MSKRAKSWVIVCVLLAVFLLYPFETTVVPQWRIRVVDESGNPVRGVGVNEGWRHYSIERSRHEQSLVTDDEGYVTFPRRTVRAGLLVRAVGSMIAALNPHGRSGPHAFLDVLGPYSSRSSTDYSPQDPLPSTVVVRRLNETNP
jgi:hypothetical protein